MRLRELFRGPTNERKPNQSMLPTLDMGSFFNAVQDKDTDLLQKHLSSGFSPDQCDPITNTTALHIAVECANIRAVQILLQTGAQVNPCDASISTPLHLAAYLGYDEIVQLLLSSGGDMYKEDNTGRNPFHLAVSSGNNRSVQHFLSYIDHDQNIIVKPDAQNWTPLMCACASNHSHTCSLLLYHGADICAVNNQGMNVFHIAAFLGSLNMINELLNSLSEDDSIVKALNHSDHRNQTPLFYACGEGHYDVALSLIHAGANAYHLDNNNQTCLHAMLSSSVILKRHIRLFYRFIEFVDFRLSQDEHRRTLLDLAYLSKMQTLIDLLTLLKYKSNYNFPLDTEPKDKDKTKHVHSLRHLCIISFKCSIIYRRNQKQFSQHDLLVDGLQQTFKINPNEDIGSHDDTLQSNKKQKKQRKTLNLFSTTQHDSEQQTTSTWSMLTSKFKPQRSTNSQQDSSSMHTPLTMIYNNSHPMKHLALSLILSPTKIHNLLDFPSLNNNPLLDEDIQTTINILNLNRTYSSNQI